MGNKITIKTVGKPVAFLLIGLFLYYRKVLRITTKT